MPTALPELAHSILTIPSGVDTMMISLPDKETKVLSG